MAIITKRYAHLNQADSGSLHRKLDATEAYITGSLTAASTILVKGAADFESTMLVQGAATLESTLDVQGAAVLSSSLEVQAGADMRDVLPNADLSYDLGSAAKRWAEIHAGTAAFTNLEADYLDVAVTASVAQLTGSAGAKFTAGDVLVEAGKVSASNDLQAGGALAVAGNSDLNGSLDVALASDLHGAVIAYSTLNVQGDVDLDQKLNVDGAADLKSTLFVTGAVELKSTLDVDGAAEFHSTVSASGNAQLGGTLTVAGNADLNGQLDVAGNFSVASTMFSVIAASGDTSIAGDLVVSGDLTVMGDRIEAQITELRIEDGLITLMSGSPSRAVSDGAGVEIDVGDGQQGARPALAFSNAEDAWTSNLDFNPTVDLTYDLGVPTKRWRELNLSGDANIGGAIDAGSLEVSGEAIFGAGIAVTGTGSFTGDLSAATGSFKGGIQIIDPSTNAAVAEITNDGSATLANLWATSGSFSGDVAVVGDLSARSGSFSGEIRLVDGFGAPVASINNEGDALFVDVQASSLSVTGLSDLDNLNVSGTAEFAQGIAVTGSGSFSGNIDAVSGSFSGDLSAVDATLSGDLSAASGSFSGDLDVYGTATFHGTFAVPGTGDFGSLVVGGINMSPISSSSPVSTVDGSSTVMLTQTLVDGDMAKYEIEVIARGGSNAASWKISVAASCAVQWVVNPETGGAQSLPVISAAATELSKEFFGSLGANLDVDIQVSGGTLDVVAKGAASAGTVYWDCQIVKKMVLDSANGARKY